MLLSNPFKVFTPEDMEADDANALFVDDSHFNKIRDTGHTIVSGPRGCGKSMIFRYLLPDCQCLANSCRFTDLSAFAVLISIKNTVPNVTELKRLTHQHANFLLNEHLLTVFVAAKLFDSLSKGVDDRSEWKQSARAFFTDAFIRRLQYVGWTETTTLPRQATAAQILKQVAAICDYLFSQIIQYVKRLSFGYTGPLSYSGALCGYIDFLFPLLKELRAQPFMPSGPIYLLMDDADYLSNTQTRILNTWVSTRTAGDVSIKISTQLRYKTYGTISGPPIQSPHDYQEVNIADIYTSSRSIYPRRVEAIVAKRLDRAGIQSTPREFFPSDQEQDAQIARIAQEIKENWQSSGRGYRADDDVTRYARPEFFKRLAGASKSTSSYSYSGFDQLVHISSGLVRYFLEPAAQMFDEERALSDGKSVARIRQSIQNTVIRAEAEKLMFSEFDKIMVDEQDYAQSELTEQQLTDVQHRTEQLRNLIRVLGNTFYQKLISDDAERRVFSIALSNTPDKEIVSVLELGVRYGYFHRSSIGNKDGTGRTRLYVLTRRLAPHFNLDPSSFAGYLFVTNELLHDAINNPDRTLRRIKSEGPSRFFDESQLTLFD